MRRVRSEPLTLHDAGKSFNVWVRLLPIWPKDQKQKGYYICVWFLEESTIFDKLLNEVMSNLYVLGSRMLNHILRDVNGTRIVTIDSKMLLTNTIIMEEFLHP